MTSAALREPLAPVFVFYDGECATCSHLVRFLLARVRAKRFRFLPLASVRNTNIERIIKQDLNLDLASSLIVWKNGVLYARMSAVCVIASELGWPWYLFLLLRLCPLVLSNWFYDLYARHRYQILGRSKEADLCQLVPSEQKQLFPESFSQDLPVFSPEARTFLSAQWRDLIFVNYAVPASVLQEFIPPGTELDEFEGQCLISIVAFAFVQTSLAGMCLPFHGDFEELNLRFYVRRKVLEEGQLRYRRGVVFIKEIVPHATLAVTARLFYGERYVQEPCSSSETRLGARRTIAYTWGKGSDSCRLSAELEAEGQPVSIDSLPGFITEHYFGYAQRGKEKTIEYEVQHPLWNIHYPAKVDLSGPWQSRYPESITQHMKQIHSALVAEGSVVRILKGQVLAR